jgi:hypothetical protein
MNESDSKRPQASRAITPAYGFEIARKVKPIEWRKHRRAATKKIMPLEGRSDENFGFMRLEIHRCVLSG